MAEVVRRSRFIASLGPAPDPEEAQAFIRSVRQSFPDATHHAWAYVVGPPASTAQVGMSDDGEPHGTAGRPILNVLLHSGIGDVVAVVTRYFGGVKLGTGGLSRAYAGVVSRGLEALPTAERARLIDVTVEVPFASADALFRLLEELGARDRTESYGSGVVVRARIPERALEELRAGVATFTSGRGRVVESA